MDDFSCKKSIDIFLLHFKETVSAWVKVRVAFLWRLGGKQQNRHHSAPLNFAVSTVRKPKR